jgi:hypothetical protein
MTAKNADEKANTVSRWFDETQHMPIITQQAERLESFVAALADGRVDEAEVKAQEQRVVDLMKQIEPQLAEPLHGQVTQLLCELTAYDLMRMLHEMQKARPATVFRG